MWGQRTMTTNPPSRAGLRRLVPWIVLVLLAAGGSLAVAGDTATDVVEPFSRWAGVFDQDIDPLGADHRDTRLVPGETRKFAYAVSFDPDSVAFPLEIVLELRYHIMHETEAVQFGFSPEQVTSSIRVERLSVPRGGRR